MPAPRPERGHDRGHVRRRVDTGALAILVPCDAPEVGLVSHELRGHRFDCQHIIDLAGGRGALRHSRQGVAVIFSLSQCQTAMFLDRSHPQRAIAARARQDDADGVLALILSERLEECIDRPAAIARRGGFDDLQAPARNSHRRVRRNNEDAVWLDHDAVGRLDHIHLCGPADKIGQHALVVGRQVLNEHEREAGVGRSVAEEALEGIKAARRCADADDHRHAGA